MQRVLLFCAVSAILKYTVNISCAGIISALGSGEFFYTIAACIIQVVGLLGNASAGFGIKTAQLVGCIPFCFSAAGFCELVAVGIIGKGIIVHANIYAF